MGLRIDTDAQRELQHKQALDAAFLENRYPSLVSDLLAAFKMDLESGKFHYEDFTGDRVGKGRMLILECDDFGFYARVDNPQFPIEAHRDSERIIRVIQAIPELDNMVQRSCKRDFERGEHTDYLKACQMLTLVFATYDAGEMRLYYYGEIVNTEWAAVFSEEEQMGDFKPTNFLL